MGAGFPNPDRLVFPVAGFTKQEVVDLYARLAPWLLPHLRDRPVTLKRFPAEVGGRSFWEKDAPAFTPRWVRTVPVWRRSGESQINYLVLDDERSLLWAASVGALELHPFLHRASSLARPETVVFDLDPGEGASLLSCAAVALLLRERLGDEGLECFAKVSGSQGLQVVVPLNTAVLYTTTQRFARAVAADLARRHPDRIVAGMERARRRQRVFIDWSQNADYKTTVAVYSLRARRRHPYVSMPVSWDELRSAVEERRASPLYFVPDEAVRRLERGGDLFAPVLELRQRLASRWSVGGRARRTSRPPAVWGTPRAPRASAQGGRRRFALRGQPPVLALELEESALAWRLPGGLPARAGRRAPAEALDRSRRLPRAETDGTWELIEGDEHRGFLDVFLSGSEVRGEWVLARPADEERWEIFRPRSNEDRRWTEPGFVQPMQPRRARALPRDRGWLVEPSFGGSRALAVKRGAEVGLLSGRGASLSGRFPSIVEALARSALPDCTLDGEVITLDRTGRPLIARGDHPGRPVYYVFDLLRLEGRDTRGLSLDGRRELLAGLASRFPEPVRLTADLGSDAAVVLAEAKRLGLPGVVAKRRASRYEAGKKSGDWVEIRAARRTG